MNSRREFLQAVAASAALASVPSWTTAANDVRRPNIIVILADDLGSADTGFQGCKDIPTPHLDALAAGGVRFTQGYVSCPVCSPTRAGFITSRYQQRFGHEFNPPARTLDKDIGLPLDEATVPKMLQDAGYVTGHIGKWHLGASQPYRPWNRGFTETYSMLGGGHDYFKQAADEDVPNEYQLPILRNGEPVKFTGYLTDALSTEAAAFVQRHKDEPYFLYLAYNAPHNPLQATEEYLTRVAGIADEKRRTYAAMICAVDDGVGQLIGALRETGQEENTLIFFFSDNGGPTAANGSSNAPLRGGKGGLYEGGTRVPFIAQWKGTLPAGRTFDAPVIALDIGATAVALAGATVPPAKPLDGVNLIPHLKGEVNTTPHEALYWRQGGSGSVRAGDWKLMIRGANPPELYNLAADPGEKTSLADEQPGKVKELRALYDAWNAKLAEPRWVSERRAAPKQKAGK